ncbi:MAG: ABC transporter substrate-binding protein [Defluviitaleaceae bacterium]|nr:ABC transporter substrate-binding protein [Defluviitaleaceae bacterium]
MLKRGIGLLVMCLLAIGVFVGCGGRDDAVAAIPTTPAGQQQQTTPGQQGGNGVEAPRAPLTDAERIAIILGDMVIPPLPAELQGHVVNLGYFNCDHMTAAPTAYYAGIFTALGLTVSMTGHGGVPEAMAGGHMDMGLVDHRLVFAARRAGSPIVVVAENHIGGAEYLVVANHIQTPEDLLGARIATNNADPLNFLNWVEMLGNLNLPTDLDAYELHIMSQIDAHFAFQAGQLDAFITCDPWASYAEYRGTGWIMIRNDTDRTPQGLGHGTCCKVVMRIGFGEEHPLLAERMILAHTIAIQFMYMFPYRAAEIFAHAFVVPLEVGLITMWRKLNYEGRTISWDFNQQYFQNQIDTLAHFNIRDDINDARVENYVDMSFFSRSGAVDFDTFIRNHVDPVFPLGMSYDDWRAMAVYVDRIVE